jgi:hypothetical protein
VACAECGAVVRFAPGGSSASRLIRRYRSWVCFALVVGATLVATLGPGAAAHGRGAPVEPRISVTAKNGYTVSEAGFLNYLGQVDAKLLEGQSHATLVAVGRSTCAIFGRGETQVQVAQTEKAMLQRRGSRISAAQVGEVVPAAVLELCPVYLPTITTAVA